MGTRQDKLNKQIQKDLGNILDAAARQLYPSVMISVLGVKVTPDLSLAKVYLSVFNAKNPDTILDDLTKRNGQVRHMLAQEMKDQVRKIPELVFYLDDSMERSDRINSLLSQVNKEEEE